MADPEHIKRLLEGVEAWNERWEHKDFKPDLSDTDLYDKFWRHKPSRNLIGRMEGINLANINFRGANLANTKFGDIEANLTGADLRETNLTDADLRNADLTGANLAIANLSGTNFRDATLQGAILTGAKPWKAKLYTPSALHQGELTLDKPIKTTSRLLGIIQRVQNLYKNHEDGEEVRLYFRGESGSGCEWQLRPSVMRDSFAEHEGKMLVELESRRPEEFDGMTSALAKWVLAQHHGLRTRFLDVTKNPLVALFYACKDGDNESKGESGRLHIFAVPRYLIKPFNSDAVSVLTNFARLKTDDQDLILGKRKSRSGTDFLLPYSELHTRYTKAMNLLYQLIHQEKPYFAERINIRDLYQVFVVEPQQSHERIRAQAGAFLASAFHLRFERDEILKWNADIPVYDHYKLTVPGERKTDILEELRLLNITREALFPGLDSSAQAITELYKQRVVGDQNE